ncbi:MAG: hypothetical protein RIG84_03545 [Roseovarius sp.]
MSEHMTVKPGERGLVWVFSVDLEGDDLKRFTRRNGSWPVEQALGAEVQEPEHVEIFPVGDLGELGLEGYLEEGMGIPHDQVADARQALAGAGGTVMVLSSRAFGQEGAELRPSAPLRHLASFSEEHEPVQFEPLRSAAATEPAPAKGEHDSTPSPRLSWGAWVAVALFVVLGVAALLFARGGP